MLSETPELQYAEILEQRASLTVKERQNLQSALSGYQGKCVFDQCVLNMFQHNELILADLNLSYQG